MARQDNSGVMNQLGYDETNHLKIMKKRISIECCIDRCTSKNGKQPNINYYAFPRNHITKTNWGILISSLNNQSIRISDHKKVCSLHFPEDYIDRSRNPPVLQRNALPVLFPHSQDPAYVRQLLNAISNNDRENCNVNEPRNFLIKISQYAYNEYDKDPNFFRTDNFNLDIKTIDQINKEECDILSKNFDLQRDVNFQMELEQQSQVLLAGQDNEMEKKNMVKGQTKIKQEPLPGTSGQNILQVAKQPQYQQRTNNGQIIANNYSNVKMQNTPVKRYITDFTEKDMLLPGHATKCYKLMKEQLQKQDEHIKILKENNHELLEKLHTLENFRKHVEHKYGIVFKTRESLDCDDNIEYVPQDDDIIDEDYGEGAEEGQIIIGDDEIIIEDDEDIVEEISDEVCLIETLQDLPARSTAPIKQVITTTLKKNNLNKNNINTESMDYENDE